MNIKMILPAVAVVFALAGCVPGEAEFTMKTSEVLKALRGEQAHVRVHEKMETVLSNAYRAVTFGDGRFTNQLDVVKMLAEYASQNDPLRFFKGERTNDWTRIRVEEKPGQLPVLRMEADLGVWLSQANVFQAALREGKIEELSALTIDGEDGSVSGAAMSECAMLNDCYTTYRMSIVAQSNMLRRLFGDEENDFSAVCNSFLPVLEPTFMQTLSCVIVGDSDEPLFVTAEEAKVNGTYVKRFEGTVRRGETLRLDVKKDHKHCGVRFMTAEMRGT